MLADDVWTKSVRGIGSVDVALIAALSISEIFARDLVRTGHERSSNSCCVGEGRLSGSLRHR